MRNLLHRGGVAMLASIALVAASVGFGCGGSDSNKPDDPEPVPDFTLLDVNSHSPTHQQAVTFSTFSAGKAVMLFFGQSTCGDCRAQFAGMNQIVTELGDEGIAATGAFVNHPDRADQAYWFDEVGASIPALQDTITTVEGTNVPALGYLMDCVSAAGKEFLLIDPDGYQQRKTKVGEDHDVNLTTEAGRETVKAWIRDFF